jgi:hypothetical protein
MRRIFSAVLAGLLPLTAACTGDVPSPAPDAPTSPSAAASQSADPPSSADPTLETTPAPDLEPEEDALLDQVRADGEISVIVEVVLDGSPGSDTREERRLIAEAQDDLIAELDPAHATVTRRYDTFSQLALRVDDDGLLGLFRSSRVSNIWVNESHPLE